MQDCDKAKNQKKDLQEAIGEKEKEIGDAKNENPPDEKKIKDLEKELDELKKAFSVLESSLMNCCGFGGPGGGIGDGLPPKDDDGGISLPEVTLPKPTVPPPAPEYQYAACDYTSPDFNKMHKCVLKEKFEPGDIPCDVNQNQTAMVDPASMDQQSQQNFISKFTN